MSLRDTPPAARAPLGGSEVHVVTSVGATNEKFRLPPPLFDARCKACWFVFGLVCLTVASFWTLELKWAQFFSVDAARKMGKFINELLVPETEAKFMAKLVWAALETLAMSALGTLLAVVMGLALALPASKAYVGDPARWRGITRLLLNALRSIPELVWAALLLISAGLGPFAGTLALALHTTGVLGRLFAEALENAPAGPATALRTHGVAEGRVFWYATLAAGAAATIELLPVPLGEQHPRGCRAGRGGCGWLGADAGLSYGPVPDGRDQQHPDLHDAIGSYR